MIETLCIHPSRSDDRIVARYTFPVRHQDNNPLLQPHPDLTQPTLHLAIPSRMQDCPLNWLIERATQNSAYYGDIVPTETCLLQHLGFSPLSGQC
jgi:hypothetical protein